MSKDQETARELIPVGADNPHYYDEEDVDHEELRDGAFWKTAEGYVAIEEMDDQHLVNARRHAGSKAGECLLQVARLERKGETMLLKYQQLTREAKSRGLLVHQTQEEAVLHDE